MITYEPPEQQEVNVGDYVGGIGTVSGAKYLGLTANKLAKIATDLGRENAKLREYITRLEQANIVLDSDNCDLRNDMRDMQFFIAENRKLRELVRDMCVWAYINEQCDLEDEFADRMRELGMEVDG